MLYEETTEKIIQCYYDVYNTLGYGFLEKVYENALLIKLRSEGFSCLQQTPVEVCYMGEVVGSYFADIILDSKIIIEIKAGDSIHIPAHEYQLINYLKATEIEVGLLLFFGKNPVVKRKIFSNPNN